MDLLNLPVGRIKEAADNAGIAEKIKLIEILEADTRSGVKSIVKRLKKEVDDHNKEIDRINKIKFYEQKYYAKGAKYIAGIDEVGRGPLAGPVYASAVIFPADCIIEGINDSKKLSPQKRSQLYPVIKSCAISYATGCCDEKTIDRVNILNATFMAMKEAISKLTVKPDVILIDAVRIPGIDIFQVPIIKGDALSFSIGAASIIAKVERDNYMDICHEKYPVYNFASNKGYGSQEHMDAIRKYGPCPLHRKTFIEGITKGE